ncbi:MAG TPA: hypothetical protein VIF81_00075 [Pyrinomonadaceae bacterium]
MRIIFRSAVRMSLPAALFVFVSSSGNSIQATTIVVARTANEIVIGADSKVTDAYGGDLKKQSCKILQIGNLLLAFEGFTVDRRTGSNVPDIARQSLQSKGAATAAEKVGVLTGLLVSKLFDELPSVQKHEPEAYHIKFSGGRIFLSIVIAGFEKGRPLVFVRHFRAVQVDPERIGVSVLPDDCLSNCQGEVVTRFLGETAAIDGLPDDTTGFWQPGLVAGVRQLIETEISARSEYVGPPIDIVRIDKRGVSWIQKRQNAVAHKPGDRASPGRGCC